MAEYEHRLVAYLDVLGWSDFVERSLAKPELIDSILTALSYLPTEIPGSQPPKYGTDNLVSHWPQLTQFSDTVVISCALDPCDPYTVPTVYNLLCTIQGVSLLMLANGFPIRGGIADGPMYHSQNHVFGPALNVAVRLEKTDAIFPRVVLQPNPEGAPLSAVGMHKYEAARKTLRNNTQLGSYFGAAMFQNDILGRRLKIDEDGMRFVDFLSGTAGAYYRTAPHSNLGEIICRRLEEHKLNPPIYLKYQWLKRYHDKHYEDLNRAVS